MTPEKVREILRLKATAERAVWDRMEEGWQASTIAMHVDRIACEAVLARYGPEGLEAIGGIMPDSPESNGERFLYPYTDLEGAMTLAELKCDECGRPPEDGIVCPHCGLCGPCDSASEYECAVCHPA